MNEAMDTQPQTFNPSGVIAAATLSIAMAYPPQTSRDN